MRDWPRASIARLGMNPVRLQKFLAESGAASRRAAEQLILAGRVSVNGEIVRELGTKVHPTADQVVLDGQTLHPRKKTYVALHKPPGYHCTRTDGAGRKVIADLLPKEWGHLYSVGRLDCQSEGLIFLTNDGQFANQVSHPRFGSRKVYLVQIQGRAPASIGPKLRKGIADAGQWLKANKASIIWANNSESLLEIVLTEGKNREIRRLFGALGLQINRLQRIQIGPIKLGQLPKGKWRTLTESEINSLLPKI